jgi:hypothetical protein
MTLYLSSYHINKISGTHWTAAAILDFDIGFGSESDSRFSPNYVGKLKKYFKPKRREIQFYYKKCTFSSDLIEQYGKLVYGSSNQQICPNYSIYGWSFFIFSDFK